MATLISDLTTDISLVEDRGAVIQLTRRMMVTDLSGTDPQVLQEALDVGGMPAENTSPTGYDNLLLVKRTVRIIDGNPKKATVDLEYVSKADAGRNFKFSGSTSVRQITTSFDLNGRLLTVSHTYPDDDPDFAGRTDTQVAEVEIFAPQTTLIATNIVAADYPHAISSQWTGVLNSKSWAGGAPFTWMITRIDFSQHNEAVSPVEWEFTYEFQFDRTTHLPVIFYIDQRTGRAPDGLVPGTGWKQLNGLGQPGVYLTGDFNRDFPVIQ